VTSFHIHHSLHLSIYCPVPWNYKLLPHTCTHTHTHTVSTNQSGCPTQCNSSSSNHDWQLAGCRRWHCLRPTTLTVLVIIKMQIVHRGTVRRCLWTAQTWCKMSTARRPPSTRKCLRLRRPHGLHAGTSGPSTLHTLPDTCWRRTCQRRRGASK